MDKLEHVALYREKDGSLWMAKEDPQKRWVPYHKITTLIEGDNLIVSESSSTMEVVS